MTASEDFDVVIVGGGMAGLALASALRNSSLTVALVEANSAPTAVEKKPLAVDNCDPRVSALALGSIELLKNLGAWETIEKSRHCSFDGMHVWDAVGTASIDFNAADVDQSALGYIVENSVIQFALHKTLQKSANVQMINGIKVVAMRNSAESSAVQELDLDDGRRLSAQLIVAADGGNSEVRRLAGFETRKWSYHQQAIVATVRTASPHSHIARQRFLPHGPLAFLPLSDEALGTEKGANCSCFSSIVWSADTSKAEDLMALDDEGFCQQLTRAFEAQMGPIEEVSKRYSFPLRQSHAVDYVKPGIVLIGDAAHVIHPLAGQGVNLGLQDVRVLSEELLRAHESSADLGGELSLRRYQRRRKADNLAMMAAMEGFKRLFGSRALPLIWLRNAGMRQLNRLEPVKHHIVRQAMGL